MFERDDLFDVLDALRGGVKSEGDRSFERRLPAIPIGGYWANGLGGQAKAWGLMANDAIFYSEAHFQLLFAMAVYRLQGERFDCMPEYPIYVKGKRCEVDLLIKDRRSGEYTVIEFKYKTANSAAKDQNRHLIVPTALGQDFEPSNDLAHDPTRYDVLFDLSRTRDIIDDPSLKVVNGFVVFLTNDHAYWDHDADFDLRHSQTINPGLLAWKKPVNQDSVGKRRLAPIAIKRPYRLLWRDYFRVSSCLNNNINLFKILVIEA